MLERHAQEDIDTCTHPALVRAVIALMILKSLGIKAMEVAIERHSLGYRYELTPTFFEDNDLHPDGTPKNSNLLGPS